MQSLPQPSLYPLPSSSGLTPCTPDKPEGVDMYSRNSGKPAGSEIYEK